MMERWKQWTETLDEVWCMSKKEYFLTLTVCVLGGIVAGMLFSPRKTSMVGSLNGNGNGDCCECECECEE